MAYYSRPEELLARFIELFEANKGLLGFNYVAVQDEDLLPEYPVIEVSSGAVSREIHATQKFLVTFEMSFWVYHANYEATHADRTREDMELATKVVHFLHQPNIRKLEDPDPKIIFGFVSQELPGVAVVGQSRILATRLIWQGQSVVNFEDS